ncbi:MAG: hypothetical protein ACTSV1_02230 [Alphaproteobacteria bacterium]
MNTAISIDQAEKVQLDSHGVSGEFCGIVEGRLAAPVTREAAEKKPSFYPLPITVYGFDRAGRRLQPVTVTADNFWDAFDKANTKGGSAFDPLLAEFGAARKVLLSPIDLLEMEMAS